ncbi:ABC transporter ATP-binding protein [Mesorhizobium sp. M7A.F.Ca.CA.001.09.2.1]|uniref:ABC transporter ATP-binding protein n=3 Tax=Mesorhizobium TaxID=68287 RepID=A0AB38THZ7_9HYPH|nr:MULTISPECIES: ABC transporter ATP-binding protein [Mesorhizobium]RUY57392.1 ABC transporter ATP-binding protein [Mesorhizobium sp. M7A.F.Ca.CA.001.13.2.1]RVA55255.1 ABC transporter ATP-binding protein [Mesorhizobium sp. M7A.F.Ca.US.001.01.1.1]MDF3212225.1 ABC transporter ATP-binding protein [Mesorhizobium ciceri]RUY55171.1 ABC transporter ATP-binding protein [Mesorhizobium sp. M7A.F.Ca.CA.001.05.1.1]RUY72908.1 ABC transporter ATP-binding protein [Mesorhizobium sp. M7A.F.Ca.CA.001.13.1.1]
MTLVFQSLRKVYGEVVAIDDVSTDFAPGMIHGVIGPNGAGKSTLINMTAGSYTVSSGSITLDGKRLDKLKKYQIANSGIARTYQNIRLFDQMSAIENLEVCFYPAEVAAAWSEVIWPPYANAQRRRRREKCMEILRFFDLQGYADVDAGGLPYGRQRMLEIARALVANPRVLLLDEPAAGLNHHETAELTAKLTALRSPDRIMIVVEHDMDLVMTLCDSIIVMHHGKLLFRGTPSEVQASTDVQLAYLGTANDIDDIRAAAQDRRAQLGIRTRRRS